MTVNSFPTLGEVLKFLFNTTDLISDSENKKLVQKQLQRLANEEGNISESLERLLNIFRHKKWPRKFAQAFRWELC